MAVIFQGTYTAVIELEQDARDLAGNSSSTDTVSRVLLANQPIGNAPEGGSLSVSATELTIRHSRSASSPQPPRYGATDLFDPNKRYRLTIEEEEV